MLFVFRKTHKLLSKQKSMATTFIYVNYCEMVKIHFVSKMDKEQR